MSYEIVCKDSYQWLTKIPNETISNIITGIPDLNEIDNSGKMTQSQYIKWFCDIAKLIFNKTNPDGYVLFTQTDRKIDGQTIDKSYWLTNTAYQCGYKLLWHKIICVRSVGKTDLFRPTYSHMLCYSKSGKPGSAFPDIIDVSSKLYDNGTPVKAAELACEFVSKHSKTVGQTKFDVIDPFVGQGTIGVFCIKSKLTFLGIDIDPEQCKKTKQLLQQV